MAVSAVAAGVIRSLLCMFQEGDGIHVQETKKKDHEYMVRNIVNILQNMTETFQEAGAPTGTGCGSAVCVGTA
jgi:glutamate 5-kinase